MNIIQQATRKLDELQRRGVLAKTWRSVGLPPADSATLAEAERRAEHEADATPFAAGLRLDMFTARLAVTAPNEPAAAPARPAGAGPTVDLDLAALERKGWVGARYARTRLAEELRHLKRPLLANARDPQAPVAQPALIMVTSATGSEGKTFTAINLAMSIALEPQTRVLLVDADVLRPGLADNLGFEAGKGLIDLLLDDSLALADVVLGTNIPRLSILPAGTRSAMSAELFAGAAMASLLHRMCAAAGCDIVVFDAPPILPTNEAKLLAGQVGQVVLVVEAGRTPRSAVAQALAELEACPLVMPMLNRSTDPISPSTYGGYAG